MRSLKEVSWCFRGDFGVSGFWKVLMVRDWGNTELWVGLLILFDGL